MKIVEFGNITLKKLKLSTAYKLYKTNDKNVQLNMKKLLFLDVD